MTVQLTSTVKPNFSANIEFNALKINLKIH